MTRPCDNGEGLRSTLPVPTQDAPCVVCGRPRMVWRSARYAPGQTELDPFDCTACCRAFFGCELPATTTGPRQQQAAA